MLSRAGVSTIEPYRIYTWRPGDDGVPNSVYPLRPSPLDSGRLISSPHADILSRYFADNISASRPNLNEISEFGTNTFN